MSLTLEPYAKGDDPLVRLVETLHGKIADENLSFHKYLVREGYPPPNVSSHFGSDDEVVIHRPVLSQSPAVVLNVVPTEPVQDRGAGDERHSFSVGVDFLLDLSIHLGDERVGIEAVHELIRTIFAGFRAGVLDPLQAIGILWRYEIVGDITPAIASPSKGIYSAESFFLIKFTFNEKVLG